MFLSNFQQYSYAIIWWLVWEGGKMLWEILRLPNGHTQYLFGFALFLVEWTLISSQKATKISPLGNVKLFIFYGE